MAGETMKYVIDWMLDEDAFQRQVRELIHLARNNSKVIALPIRITPGQTMFDLMTLLLAPVNCEGCQATCCKVNPGGLPIEMLPPEYQRLSEKYGAQHFIESGSGHALPMPCPFLKSAHCSIYDDRPLVCVLYPFQFGANDGSGDNILALASSCPESRRIARTIYKSAWRIRRQFHLLGEDAFLKGIIK